MPLGPAPRRKILVVDDSRDAADTLAYLLRQLGHEVQTAYDGRAAVGLAHQMRPEIIFLDLGLPGYDGFRVAQQIRSDPAFTRTLIVAVTGLAHDYERTDAERAGVDVYLVKPVDPRFIESFVGDARA